MSYMKRMDPAVKAKWLTALRSGDYKQVKGCLRGELGYCCLGVLTDVWAGENSIEWNEPFVGAYSINAGGPYTESSVTPRDVMQWSELENSTGAVIIGTVREGGNRASESNSSDYPYDLIVTLSDLNDNGLTFEQIADVIEYAL
ncbi:MAG TPA: hypothetical protein VIY48_07255 [Candidatus Paceibacterota bacterium]